MLRILAAMSYPILIYAALHRVGPRALAVALTVVLLLGHGLFTWRRRGLAPRSSPILVVAVVLILAALFNDGQFFLLVPVSINAGLLIAFGRTLWHPPSMVETFARLRGRELSKDEVVYCRVVTGVWCLFFVLNGGLIVWFALYASLAWWTLYTGALSYVLIAILFATEMTYRYWRFRPYDGSLTDPLFHRIFPPRGRG